MKRKYYICWYCLDNKDSYLIWFSDEKDGVFVDENGFVPSFSGINELQIYSGKNKINIEIENPKLFDLDLIQNWLAENKSEIVDYNTFNNAWNLFDDVSNSTNGSFDTDKKLTQKIYDKIFWSCNLPGITPEGKSYEPIWTRKELKAIHETLNFGIKIFREKVKVQ